MSGTELTQAQSRGRCWPLMPRLYSLIVWVLAATWLPATLHCAIDRAGLLSATPECCSHDEQSAPEADRCDIRCELLDSGCFQTVKDSQKVAAPTLLPLLLYIVEAPLAPEMVQQVSPETVDLPPELERTWQFVSRAALPPRAP